MMRIDNSDEINKINDWYNHKRGQLQDNHSLDSGLKSQLFDALFIEYCKKLTAARHPNQ